MNFDFWYPYVPMCNPNGVLQRYEWAKENIAKVNIYIWCDDVVLVTIN